MTRHLAAFRGAARWLLSASSEVRMLLQLLAGRRRKFVLLVVFGLAASFAETFAVSLTVLVIYKAGLGLQFPLGQNVLGDLYRQTASLAGDSVLGAAAVLAISVILRQVFVGGREIVSARVCNDAYDHIRTSLFNQNMQVTYQYFASKKYGEMTNVLLSETWRVSQAIEQFSRVVSTLCSIMVYLIVLLAISWPAALVAVGSGLLVMAMTQLFRGSLRTLSRGVSGWFEQMAERMVSSIHAMRTIRTHGIEGREMQRFRTLSREAARVSTRLVIVDNACRPLIEVATLGAIAAVVWVSYSVGNPPATTVAILALLFRLQPQVRTMQNDIVALIGAQQSMVSVLRALDRSDKPYPIEGTRRPASFHKDLTFHEVWFTHLPHHPPTLKEASFTIKPGMTVLIRGPSGSGKSTIVNLLLKLYEPTKGVITVDGVPLPEIDRLWWLHHVGVAGQDIDLVDGSILDNVRLAHENASISDVENAIRQAGIKGLIDRLPDGLRTTVGERGFSLSGGQRQRIGLARALVGKPDILILDEATNAVAPALEDEIHQSIRAAYPDLTMLIIAHRNDIAIPSDMIIATDQGEVSAVHMARTGLTPVTSPAVP